MKAAGGKWTAQELAGYQVKEREPLRFEYDGWDIVTEEPGDTVKLTETGRLVLDWITGDYPASG